MLRIRFIQRLLAMVINMLYLWPLASHAQLHTAAVNPSLALDPAVRTGRLPNGFTYFIRHNNEPANRVIFYLANKAGSILEDDDQRGLAHFTEHMSFNGTVHFPKNELVNYLQKSGVRFGADINAFTDFDETVYQLPLPADDPALLKNGMEILHDWCQGATLDSIEIEQERGVVLEEQRLGKGAKARMQDRYMPALLNHYRYADRDPIGLEETLKKFKPTAIRRFYKDWYRPDLQALIVVGDVDVDQMERLVKAKFADLQNPLKERKRIAYNVPLTGKNQFIRVTDPEMTSIVAEVITKHPKLAIRNLSQYRSSIVRSLINIMLSERFKELKRQPDPLFLQANAGISGFTGGMDIFDVSVVAKPGGLEAGFKSVWREIERAKRFGFTAPEIDRAKMSFLVPLKSALKERNKTGSESYVNEYLQYFLNGTVAPGVRTEFKLISQLLPGITAADILQALDDQLKPVNRDIVVMAPEKDRGSLPDENTFNRWINDIRQIPLVPYHEEPVNLPLLSGLRESGRVVREVTDTILDLQTLTLTNGVRVLLKKTNFKNDELIFSGFASGGTSLYADADYQSATGANIIPSFGAGNYTRNQLDKFLSGKQLSVQPSVRERSQNISGSTTNDDLETALQLVYAYFTAPRKDSALFNGMMKRSASSLADRQNDPGSVFQDTVNAVLGNHSIRRTGPSIAKLKQVDLDRAYGIYRERFADAAGFTFIFVGNMDTLRMKPLLAKYLGALPALHQNTQARDLAIEIPAGRLERTVYQGAEAKATVRLVFSGPFDYSFKDEVKMEALSESIQIRLLERLREGDGEVYSPNAHVSVNRSPSPRFTLNISFGCAPQNVEKLIEAVNDEINQLKVSGPPKINIAKFIAQQQRSLEGDMSSDDFWLSYLSEQLLDQRDIHEIKNYNRFIGKVSPEDVKEMANKYLNGQNYIKLVLMPATQTPGN